MKMTQHEKEMQAMKCDCYGCKPESKKAKIALDRNTVEVVASWTDTELSNLLDERSHLKSLGANFERVAVLEYQRRTNQ